MSVSLLLSSEDDARVALANARHANAMAKRLYEGVVQIAKKHKEVKVPNPTEANAVFPILPKGVFEKLQDEFPFYVWDHTIGQVRLMCSWDTTEADVDALLAAIKRELR